MSLINSLDNFDYYIINYGNNITILFDYIYNNMEKESDLLDILKKYDMKNIVIKKLILGKYLFPKHYPNIKLFAERAAENGFYDCFNYIFNFGWKLKIKNLGLNNQKLKEYMQQNKIKLDLGNNIYKNVICGGNFKCFTLLLTNNYIIKSDELNYIIKLDLYQHIKFIEENTSIHFTPYSHILAIKYKSIYCFRYFYELNLKKNKNISMEISLSAAKTGDIWILQFLHKYNFSLHDEIAIHALFNNNMECFNYIQNNLDSKYKVNLDF